MHHFIGTFQQKLSIGIQYFPTTFNYPNADKHQISAELLYDKEYQKYKERGFYWMHYHSPFIVFFPPKCPFLVGNLPGAKAIPESFSHNTQSCLCFSHCLLLQTNAWECFQRQQDNPLQSTEMDPDSYSSLLLAVTQQREF